MSNQHSTIIANGTGSQFRTDINGALSAMTGGQNGNTAPTVTIEFMDWIDTGSTPALWKKRNAANTDWVVMGTVGTVDFRPSGTVFRGCLVYNSTNGGSNIINWGSEAYDTDSIHSTTTNTSRLTVPSGVSKVRLVGNAYHAYSGSTGWWVVMLKNGGNFVGMPYSGPAEIAGPATAATQISSPVLAVSPGDYFELSVYNQQNDSTGHSAWFAMEIVE